MTQISSPSRAQKATKNSIFSALAFMWPIALSFIATPIVVRHIGVENYGLLGLVTAFIGFLAFLDFGISPALVKFTSEHHAKGETKELRNIFSSALFLYTVIGIIAGAFIALFAHFFAPAVFKVSAGNAETVRTVFYLAAFGFFINMVLSTYASIPGALQRFDITGKLNLIASSLSTLLTILLVMLGYGVVALVLLGILTSIGALIAYIAIKRRLLPGIYFSPRLDKDSLQKILKFGAYAFIATAAGTVLFQLDKLILGAQLGAAAVAYYILPGSVAMRIQGLIANLTNIVFPVSTELFTTGALDKLHTLYFRATRIIMTIIVLTVTPMYVLAHNFLLHWVGQNFAANSTLVFQILLATYTILALTAIPTYLTYGYGKPQYSAVSAVVSGVLNISLLFLLVPHYGINGAAWAFLLSVIPGLIYIVFTERVVLKLKTGAYYLNLLPKLMVLALVSLGLSWAAESYVTNLGMFLVAYAGIVLFSLAVFVGLRLANSDDIQLVRSIIKQRAL